MKHFLICAFAVLCTSLVTPAQALPYVLNVTGTIASNSINNAGLFGGGNLIGDTLSITEYFDPSLLTLSSPSGVPMAYLSSYYAQPLTVTASVNGSSFTAVIPLGFGYISLTNGATKGSADTINALQYGSMADGTYVSVGFIDSSFQGFVPSLDFDQTFSHTTSRSDHLAFGSFRLINPSGQETNLLFNAYGTIVTLNPIAVPEPASFALVSVGLFGLRASRRRKTT